MGLRICVAALTACAFVAVTVTAPDADAATKRRAAASKKVVAKGAPRARITVQPRSFLDPGREVLPGSQGYFTNYAFPPSYSPSGVADTRTGGYRGVLPGPFDLPGRDNPYPWHYCANC